MAEEASTDSVGPWTVKGMPLEDRAAINAAARRADMTVGEWLKIAARQAIRAERAGPSNPVVVEDRGPPAASHAQSVEVIERLAAVLPGLTSDARGGGKLAALARRVIEQHLRALMLEGESPPESPPKRLPGG